MRSMARVLIIAGSDSGGGAGIQGDIKTVTCLGGYAATAITALTVQNTTGVFGIHDVPDEFIAQQVKLVLDDIGADCIKTGMLHKACVIETVEHTLMGYAQIPLIIDPVMFAKGGAALMESSALSALKTLLIPKATMLTPNIPEAEFLADMKLNSISDMKIAAEKILALGCKAVLLKGGHLESENLTDVTDVLYTPAGYIEFSQPRIKTLHTHGTGCALASAIATGIAQKLPLEKAVARAREYVRNAIVHAPGLGQGHGPLGHNFMIKKL